MTAFRFCDETPFGFGWLAEEPFERCSHALAVDGRVWLVDPLEWPDALERAAALGEPAGVVQLLDRHNRDGAAVAARLGIHLFRLPSSTVLEGAFEVLRVVNVPRWREVALWWPGERVLVCADALGTTRFVCARGERVGVHPLLRLTPPRLLAEHDVDRLLVGHGEGVAADAGGAVRDAIRSSRRRIPSLIRQNLHR